MADVQTSSKAGNVSPRQVNSFENVLFHFSKHERGLTIITALPFATSLLSTNLQVAGEVLKFCSVFEACC